MKELVQGAIPSCFPGTVIEGIHGRLDLLPRDLGVQVKSIVD